MPVQKDLKRTKRQLAIAVALASGAIFSAASQAQESEEMRRGSSVLLEEVIVTARKREEAAREVPLSVTAFNADQINALKVRDLNDLTVGMPNVSLEDIGTARGTANFSIRGLGVNNGIIFDMFDVESLQVLRGPQGTLFGRNVTGGAVLINTKKPGDELEASVRTAVETGDIGGWNTYVMGAIGGPVTDTVGARLVLYYNDDEGQLENKFDGDDVLAIEQIMARGTLTWAATDCTDITLRYEYLDTDGDGPIAESHTNGCGVPGTPVNFERDDFDVSMDEPGSQETETNFITAQLDQQVDFGDGTVTAILGYREHEADGVGDIDAQPLWIFHAPSWLETEQTSFELRYNGVFAERTNVTVGTYYYDLDMDYHERRDFLGAGVPIPGIPAARFDGGGEYEVESYSVFAQVDYDLTENWTLTAGVNYSSEEKDASVASLSRNISQFPNLRECNIVNGPSCPFDFVDDDSCDNWAPKLGATYNIDDQRRI